MPALAGPIPDVDLPPSLNSVDHADWFRARLERGKSYTITLEGDEPYIELADSRGRLLSGRDG